MKWCKQLRKIWSQTLYETFKIQAEMTNHILHSDLKEMWDTWLIEASSELKKWTRIQKDGSTTPDKIKIARVLTEGCGEGVFL